MILGPYRDPPTLELKLKLADVEIASLRDRVKLLEQQIAFRDQQLQAERAARRQAEILRDDAERRTREASAVEQRPMTGTAISGTISFPGQWFSEWTQVGGIGSYTRTFTPPPNMPTLPALPPQRPPQSPDGFAELERRTEAVRAQRAEAYKPAPREKTRFDFLEVD